MSAPEFPAGPYETELHPTAERRAELIAEIERLDCERAALMAQLRAMAKEPTASPCLCRRASQHGPRLELSVR